MTLIIPELLGPLTHFEVHLAGHYLQGIELGQVMYERRKENECKMENVILN